MLFVSSSHKRPIQGSRFHHRAAPSMIVTWCANLVPIVKYRLMVASRKKPKRGEFLLVIRFHIFVERERGRQLIPCITIDDLKIGWRNGASTKIEYYLRILTTRKACNKTVYLGREQHAFSLFFSRSKWHNIERVTVLLHNGHSLLDFLFHSLSHSLKIKLVGLSLIIGFIGFCISQIGVSNELNRFILQNKHQIGRASKHSLDINRLQNHRFYSRLHFQRRLCIDISAFGIKETNTTIPILFINGPHYRLLRLRVGPSQLVKSQQVKLLKKHRTGRDTKCTFHNTGV